MRLSTKQGTDKLQNIIPRRIIKNFEKIIPFVALQSVRTELLYVTSIQSIFSDVAANAKFTFTVYTFGPSNKFEMACTKYIFVLFMWLSHRQKIWQPFAPIS
jgi:cellobiose-specific phosphotransferase system component IIC